MTNGKKDASGMPFAMYRCVNAMMQADCKDAAMDGRLTTDSSAGVI